MNKLKNSLMALSFAALMALVCSFIVLPVQAQLLSCTMQTTNVFGWVLCKYTLNVDVVTDGLRSHRSVRHMEMLKLIGVGVQDTQSACYPSKQFCCYSSW
jgi:hypothetical protein